MEEEIHNDALPDLRELENKVGRKTPESLLIWMRDAADCEDGGRSEVVDRGERSSALSDSFSDKINSLKEEMRWLRSADVRILRQLVAVHEGIEAMRWLMEERDNLASRDSSLTGSLSSLVTVEEHGPSMSPYRDGQASSSPANGLVSASLPKSQAQDLDIKDGAKTIRRALLRSNRARRPVIVDNGSFAVTKQSEETQTEHQTQESFRAFQNNTMEKEESPPNKDTILLGYDAQWCWVESQDDVTFL
ncbi:Leucine rich adaptor protein 1 [Nibea albiflora]|uniref:Leucine rich adaptor protein 1 n=1 Tax=Nibea albiflora TaxID=240163 RepID=A0ACB7FIW4_NIBAL|nr:Leucine rich adaptor protein 1 [Nibea albiflora]